MSLKRSTFTAVRYTAAAMLVKAGLQFIQMAILGRLLMPADFGLMAIVVALTAFLQIFADFGVSSAIVHYQEISREQLSSLYWLNLGSSIVLAILIVAAGHWISAYYLQPQLQPLLTLSAVTLIINGAGQQLRVAAEKNLRFDVLAKVEISGALAGFIFSIGIALAAGGAYALVGGLMANTAMVTVLLWLYVSDGWRPIMVFRIREIRQFLNFGAYMIGNNILNTFSYQFDVLLGGKMLGAQSLGAYSLAKEFSVGISKLFNPIITRVGTPVMAQAQGVEKSALMKKIYLQTMRMTASANFPVYIAIGVFAPEVVHLVFGDKWNEAIPLLRVFSAWGLVRSTANPVGSLLVATGRADLSFKWNLTLFFIVPPVVWLGSLWGSLGIAVSLLAAITFFFVPTWYFLVRPLCGAGFIEYSQQLLSPLFSSVISAVVGFSASWLFSSDVLRLCVGAVVGGCVYVGLSSRINREWYVPMQALLMGEPVVKH